jgi:hypothetical protein
MNLAHETMSSVSLRYDSTLLTDTTRLAAQKITFFQG